MASEFLRSLGYDVAIAFNGLRALELAETFKPEIAILDIGLPVMDGYELVRTLKERDGECRYLALTGYGQREDIERASAAGFERLLVKPVDLDILGRVLEAT